MPDTQENIDAPASEETIGEALDQKPAVPEPKEDTVPLAALLEIKKANKELTREMKELKKSIEDGASRSEVTADMKTLADKHNVDPEFLSDFAKAVRAEAKKETDEEIASKLGPLQEREKIEKIETAFKTHFEKVMEKLPEYDGVVNKDVIKALSLVPSNANKTLTKLIEESYGHLIQGKRSLDQASTRAGKNDTMEVDSDKAKKDPAYFKEIMDNPELKKKYNESMLKRITSQM